ncbi:MULTISPECIES: T9SS type A sorting domain-containing protein [unclassified Lentimicrobium]|uniref:T9SS type A sorting domain-containing protein n=1 Tax=unclassified Lentimicrobium TaxID=2677434 RepID=UPI00155548E1|nr:MULTISPECIES: T9SS type A sorting domain-containing protein [unclassified Lentimicrobium]NPD47621.1 T9SS type A sorting domain-containing protein [Lentimicrobium sp. S6]NPD84711.1 T9SS type A sorting domain-containing protein [Lentimicrobium sp. L6]
MLPQRIPYHLSLSIILGLTLISNILLAQRTELDYFEATENQDEVLLKWAISKGSTCNGITITHSSDSLYFSPIGRIEGVCGDADTPQPYSFVDLNPLKNQKNYYKLELGTSSFSEVISITLVNKNEEGYQIRPQPIHSEANIYFDNPDFNTAQLHIYNFNGQLIYQSQSRENYFEINSAPWSSGLLFFSILLDDKEIKGKLLIAH